jgi:hypothetical protein
MEPRLKSSQKWSPFPEELCQIAAAALTERFAEEYDLEKAEFVVEGQIYNEEIIGRFGLRLKDQIKQYNFEISLEYNSEKDKALELIQKSMDVVEHLWEELLEDDLEDADLSKQWQTMPFEKRMYFFRYSTVNTQLEKEADQWLKEYEKKLVYGQDDVALDAPEDSPEKDRLH